ncbi:MAG: hypothetical protein L0229_20590 [Blastocatellia bacterium]|nr:hypothetical protein [Blastocatellia bacterium]
MSEESIGMPDEENKSEVESVWVQEKKALRFLLMRHFGLQESEIEQILEEPELFAEAYEIAMESIAESRKRMKQIQEEIDYEKKRTRELLAEMQA